MPISAPPFGQEDRVQAFITCSQKAIAMNQDLMCVKSTLLGTTLPETNSSHLKMDGWNTSFLLGRPIFRGYVSFREGNISSYPLKKATFESMIFPTSRWYGFVPWSLIFFWVCPNSQTPKEAKIEHNNDQAILGRNLWRYLEKYLGQKGTISNWDPLGIPIIFGSEGFFWGGDQASQSWQTNNGTLLLVGKEAR